MHGYAVFTNKGAHYSLKNSLSLFSFLFFLSLVMKLSSFLPLLSGILSLFSTSSIQAISSRRLAQDPNAVPIFDEFETYINVLIRQMIDRSLNNPEELSYTAYEEVRGQIIQHLFETGAVRRRPTPTEIPDDLQVEHLPVAPVEETEALAPGSLRGQRQVASDQTSRRREVEE